ncbi:MAG: hypothetical protein GF344_04560, partial [Chitinivibrionales bacterium]|nr:hypothetical protein [Chitinivibrionales bacterium]MBD3356303.1 hypothetical protein [Chitinivibrionales bacterium]
MKNGDEKALRLFIEESREHLGGIEEDLLEIEQQAEQVPDQTVDKVFRAVHTLKGSAGYFALSSIKDLSHAMENVLGKIRSHELIPSSPMITALLDGADALRSLVNNVAESEEAEVGSFVAALNSFLVNADERTGTKETSSNPEMPREGLTDLRFVAPVSHVVIDVGIKDVYEAQQRNKARFVVLLEIDTFGDTIAKDCEEADVLEEIGQATSIIKVFRNEARPDLLALCASTMDRDILIEFFELPAERVSRVLTGCITEVKEGGYSLKNVLLRHLSEESGEPPAIKGETTNNQSARSRDKTVQNTRDNLRRGKENNGGGAFGQSGSLRVDIHILDRLMTLAGEIVLARNELMQNVSADNPTQIASTSQRVDGITSELQDAIMSTRMQSIGVVFRKFRRLVRDLAMRFKKQVRLDIQGEDVELDKSVIEAVADPLTHIVRNAVDHGLETPAERREKGKPSAGSLCVRARHEAGQVMIEIIDDGKGIDPSGIRKKANQLSLVDEAALASMNDREALELIFKPGFSTAEKVTEISGRGVGMDVVQSNLKKIGGAIDIDSVPGNGTTLRIKLPLTLAIIPSLLVEVEGERYAIPQANLLELVRIAASDVKNKMQTVGDAAVMRLRGELLPLIRVSDALGIDDRTYIDPVTGERKPERRRRITDRRGTERVERVNERRSNDYDRRKNPFSAVNVAVVAAGDFHYGLIVDAFLDSSEIVVKPLGRHLGDCREYAGATILGDGHVALILDVVGIKRLTGMKDTDDQSTSNMHEADTGGVVQSDRQPFLIVADGSDELCAIPVGLISRIEKIATGEILTAGGRRVVPYRGGTLRLIAVEEVTMTESKESRGVAFAVVFQIGGREVGILAANIVDIADIDAGTIDEVTHVQEGVVGSIVVHNAVTLILDLFGIVKARAPELRVGSPEGRESSCAGIVLI